jgi:hypothetical protein
MNMLDELPLSTILRLALSNNGRLCVSFRKKDGTQTLREVTADPVLIKQLGGNLPTGTRHTAEGYICAFDIHKKDWILIGEDKIDGLGSFSKKTEKMLNMN